MRGGFFCSRIRRKLLASGPIKGITGQLITTPFRFSDRPGGSLHGLVRHAPSRLRSGRVPVLVAEEDG